MNDAIKISAKNLGYTALPDFCPRCYWLRIKTNFKLPYQTFPGIFSSIDSYTKHCIHYIIDNISDKPQWMQQMGNIVGYETVPHWSKNSFKDEKTGITLHGAQDDILVCNDGTRIVPDYKTQRHSDKQDQMFELYEIQENVYSILSEQGGKQPVKLFLVYMEPCSTASDAPTNIIDCGFRMCFSAVVVPVKRNRSIVRNALNITKDIWMMDKPPNGRMGCKECESLDKIIGLLGMGPVSNVGLEE